MNACSPVDRYVPCCILWFYKITTLQCTRQNLLWYVCMFSFNKKKKPTKKPKPKTNNKIPQTYRSSDVLKECELSHIIWLNFPEGGGGCQLRLMWTTFMALEMWPLVAVNVTAWITFNYSELHSATFVLTHLTRRLLLW